MAKAMRWMGNKVVRTAQRAAHAATRNESTRARWLKTRRISTDSAGEQRQTYLSYPNHSPSTPDDPPTSRTHRITEDDSKRDLEGSVPGGGLTRSHERVEAESGESGRSETLYMDYRWRRRSSGGAIRADEAAGVNRGRPRARTSARTLAEPRLAISGNRSQRVATMDSDLFTQTRNSFVYQYFGIHSFDFIFYL